MCREYTKEEIREQFLKYLIDIKKYWIDLPGKTLEERMSGLLFTFLYTLDGSSIELPGFLLVPNSNKDDKEYYQGKNENWYPEVPDVELCDIGGALHEIYCNMDK